LEINLTSGANHLVTGRGAGRWPTTEAMIADLLDLRQNRRPIVSADSTVGAL
jgi:homoserine dehydrogenase